MTEETEAAASAAENIIDDEREDDFRGVYSLMCAEPGGTTPPRTAPTRRT